MKKILIVVGMLVIIGGGGFWYLSGQAAEENTQTTVQMYEVEEQSALHLKGQVQPKYTQTALVATDKGPIKSVEVSLGDTVKKDDVLFKYEWGEKVKADFDGVVTALDLDAENDASKPLMIIKSIESEIQGTVTEYDKEKLSKDMEVDINYVTQDKTVSGKITSIATINNEADANNLVSYDFTAQPHEDIPIGYSVEILIPRHEVHLPKNSVEVDNDKYYVYTVENNKATRHEVSVKDSEGYYLLESGINVGDKIIKNVTDISEGMEVAVDD